MAIQVPASSSFSRGLEKCAGIANPDVHGHCFQQDGTRHITMYDGTLTEEQVHALRFSGTFPIVTEFNGWKPWKAGCYLSITPSTSARLESLLNKIQGLPNKGGKVSCDHLSLYRKRDFAGGEVWRVLPNTIGVPSKELPCVSNVLDLGMMNASSWRAFSNGNPSSVAVD
eukprot:scaffold1552_cov175-Amphora_coffeaeformis.AAC.11